MSEAPVVICEKVGRLGTILLNRPHALNALDRAMIAVIDPCLQRWATDAEVAAVVFRGAGDRAFCAGGDIRAMYADALARKRGTGDGAETRAFFREEYLLDRRIATFPKPVVSLMDGITMGGGVGLSLHGSHRIATERTVWAMPETGIGLFPDVGACHVLSRLPAGIGAYLAMTGARLGAADCLALGLATRHVPSGRLDAMVADLGAEVRSQDASAAIDGVIDRYATTAGAAPLDAWRDVIGRTFSHASVEEIFRALEAEGSEWTTNTATTLARMSPTSLKIALEAMRRAAGLSLDEVFIQDYRLSQGCMRGHDFLEGVRALLVDKDRNPRWAPSHVADVEESAVLDHFQPPPGGDLPLDW